MKEILTLFGLLVAAISSRAQTVFITTGTAGTPQYNAGPVYRSAATSAYNASRYTYLYTAAELSAAGITSGSVISLVGWVKNNTATSLGSGAIFRIFMKNSSATNFSLASETWSNLNAGTTKVYENLTQTIPATATPNYIDFPLTTNFTYTGGALEISTEWDINGVTGNPSTGTFDWLWSTVPDRIYGTGNTTLAPITSLSSTTNTISTIDDRRPFIKITYSGGTTGIDVGATALIAPAVSANNCYTSAEPVTVQIRNYSTNPIDFSLNPVTVTTTVSGAVTQTLTATVNTGVLAAAATQNVTMTGTLNMNAAGLYTFNATAVVTGDVTPANNAMAAVNITKAVLATGTVSAGTSSYCVIGGTPTLATTGATGYGNIQWQQSTTSGSGFTNIPGAVTTPYTVGSAITQTMYYRLQAVCNGNTVTSNEVAVILNNPQITSTTPGATCGPGPAAVTLSATGTGTVFNWYTAATGGVPAGTGTSFTTPPISANTTYYVSTGSGGGTTNLGLPAKLAPSSGVGTTNFGLVFDALTPFTLNSVVMYPVAAAAGTAGTVTIDVINSAGVVLNTATVNVLGNPTAAPVAQTVTLNFNIAAGTNLKLRHSARSASITGLLFEPSATAPGGNYGYPFTVPGVVSITTSTLTAAPTNTARPDLYYYFYNWQIATGCESPRTAVLASITTPPSAAISYAGSPFCTSAGTVAVTQTGTAGGMYTASPAGLSINAASGTITPAASTAGIYTVTYTVAAAGGCPAFTTTASVTINAASAAPATATASNPTICGAGGGVTDLTAAGGTLGTGASYKWYSGSCGGTPVGTGAVLTNVPVSVTTTFYVRAEGTCGNTACASVTVTVTTAPAATVSYAGSPYCTTAAPVTVTQTGTTGGTYSAAPAGLSINAANGTITPATSTGGTYTVTYSIAAVGSCPTFTTTAFVTINAPSVAPTTATASVPNICGAAGVTNLTASGGTLGAGAAYKWYTGSCGGTLTGTGATLTGIPVSTTTTYYVRAEGGCGNTSCASVTVTVNPAPTVVLTFPAVVPGTPQTNPANASGLFTTVSPPGNYTYVWTLNGVVIPVTASSVTPGNGLFNGFGIYSVTATNTATGCAGVSNAITVTDIENERNRLFITPNPTRSTIAVQYYSSTAAAQARTISLYAATGQQVMSKAYTPSGIYGTMTMDISALPPGTYMVIISDASNDKIASGRVLKL